MNEKNNQLTCALLIYCSLLGMFQKTLWEVEEVAYSPHSNIRHTLMPPFICTVLCTESDFTASLYTVCPMPAFLPPWCLFALSLLHQVPRDPHAHLRSLYH